MGGEAMRGGWVQDSRGDRDRIQKKIDESIDGNDRAPWQILS